MNAIALAIGYIACLAFKCLIAVRAVFLFVERHVLLFF